MKEDWNQKVAQDVASQKAFRGIIQVKEDWNLPRKCGIGVWFVHSEALSKWRRIETAFSDFLDESNRLFRGIIQVKEDWNRFGSVRFLRLGIIPRHYPSEGGLKQRRQRVSRIVISHSEALSKWRRIETKQVHPWTGVGCLIPRHYPSEGGLKRVTAVLEEKELFNSEALSKWRRIETHSLGKHQSVGDRFRGIIQVKEDWNPVLGRCNSSSLTIPRHYPSEGGLKLRWSTKKGSTSRIFRGIIQVKEDWNLKISTSPRRKNSYSEALSKWRRIETGTPFCYKLAYCKIPRHYPSEGGLKHVQHLTCRKITGNSEALSKWRRIETCNTRRGIVGAQLFRGIIQVKEDWNLYSVPAAKSPAHIPRHYPSEGGLKQNVSFTGNGRTTYSEALSKWRRIETEFLAWLPSLAGIIPRHYPSEGGLKLGFKLPFLFWIRNSEALSKWRRIETVYRRSVRIQVTNIPRHYPSEGGLKRVVR